MDVESLERDLDLLGALCNQPALALADGSYHVHVQPALLATCRSMVLEHDTAEVSVVDHVNGLGEKRLPSMHTC
jgi:hypothetical protein